MNQTTTIAVIAILIASATISTQPTAATSQPSVPQFTVKLVDNSYDVSPTYTTNPYTGETTTNPGYHVKELIIEITVKNQPFIESTVNGNTTGLFYNVQAKTVGEEWSTDSYPDSHNLYGQRASSEDTTVVTFELGSGMGNTWDIPTNSQVEVRVQAVVGYSNFIWGAGLLPHGSEFTLLSASGWSNIQTINLGSGQTATSQPTVQPIQNPTTTPTQTPTTAPIQTNTETPMQQEVTLGFAWKDVTLVVACVVIAALAAALVLSRRNKQ